MRTHVDLFSGIGGFALACKANGVATVQFVEIDKRCRAFLAKAWPGIPIWDDVRTFHWDMAYSMPDGREPRTMGQLRGMASPERQEASGESESGGSAEETANDGEGGVADSNRRDSGGQDSSEQGEIRRTADRRHTQVWLLTAGVPCQPASRAGRQLGASDDRWLWPEALRCLAEIRPVWALFENPPGIGDVGLAGILAEMESLSYQVQVLGIPACAVGAPHRRMRYWIVAHRIGTRLEGSESISGNDGQKQSAFERSSESHLAYDNERRSTGQCGSRQAGIAQHPQGELADRVERLSNGLTIEPCGEMPSRRHVIGTDGTGWCINAEKLEGLRRYCGLVESEIGRCYAIRITRSHSKDGSESGIQAESDRGCSGSNFWSSSVLLPCADGKVRRAPEDTFLLAAGVPDQVCAELGETHRSLLAALGNSIVPQVATEIIRAMVEAEDAESE